MSFVMSGPVEGMSVGLAVDDDNEMPMVLTVSATIAKPSWECDIVELTLTPRQLAGLLNMAMSCDRNAMAHAIAASIRDEHAFDTSVGLLLAITEPTIPNEMVEDSMAQAAAIVVDTVRRNYERLTEPAEHVLSAREIERHEYDRSGSYD